jgi:hypothetical protein
MGNQTIDDIEDLKKNSKNDFNLYVLYPQLIEIILIFSASLEGAALVRFGKLV